MSSRSRWGCWSRGSAEGRGMVGKEGSSVPDKKREDDITQQTQGGGEEEQARHRRAWQTGRCGWEQWQTGRQHGLPTLWPRLDGAQLLVDKHHTVVCVHLQQKRRERKKKAGK